MKFPSPLIRGVLIQRYKRFLADVRLDAGEVVTAHTANSGSMKGLTAPGNMVWLSHHDNPARKLKYGWELVRAGPVLVGINTALPNLLVEEALAADRIPALAGYASRRREVKYGVNSRVDLLLEDARRPPCYVEVKNVTLVEHGKALFPDAVSERGRKHLEELGGMVRQGARAVLFYVVQRDDAPVVAPAAAIDPAYAESLRRAARQGVEVMAWRARVTLESIELETPLAVET
ncbi:MAG: Sugar fermentation stimulation protein A [Myxococcota bacterium]|nr:Sugar fermentation stimulation protein A [Myxococcota bacterium]